MFGILSLIENYDVGMFALYSVIGFCIVIAVLAILIVLIVLFSKVLGAISSLKKSVKTRVAESPANAETSSEEDTEIVAAVTAALMAYYDVKATADGEEVPVPFIIRSIKKN